MPDPAMNDFNTKVIEEFRANGGRVGGQFAGAPMILVTHRGARSGDTRVNPLVYQAVGRGLRHLRVQGRSALRSALAPQPHRPPRHDGGGRDGDDPGPGPAPRGGGAGGDLVQAEGADARVRRLRGQGGRYPGDPGLAPRTSGLVVVPARVLHGAQTPGQVGWAAEARARPGRSSVGSIRA